MIHSYWTHLSFLVRGILRMLRVVLNREDRTGRVLDGLGRVDDFRKNQC